MFKVEYNSGLIQEVKADWFQFTDGVLYLYKATEGQECPPVAAFPQSNVLSVRKADCCCAS